MGKFPRRYLAIGEHLSVGDYLLSIDGRYRLVMQSDGNLCSYPCDAQERETGGAVFASGQHSGGAFFVSPQSDGNFCMSSGTWEHPGGGVWCISDVGKDSGAYHAVVDVYGALCVYEGASPSGDSRLVHRTHTDHQPDPWSDDGKFKWQETEGGDRRAFFYNKRIYALSNGGQMLPGMRMVTCRLDSDGTPIDRHVGERTESLTSFGQLATCVYRGEAWLLYDRVRGDDRWKFEIRAKKSLEPAEGWLPAHRDGIGTGLIGGYADWKSPVTPSGIDAKELGDLLYVFYHRDEYIYYATFDGKTWTERARLSDDRYHPNFTLCSATRAGKPVIVFGGVPHDDKTNMHLIVLGTEGITAYGHVLLDWVQNNNRFGMGHGTIPGSTVRNALQIFGGNSGGRDDLRRVEYDLEEMRQAGEWSNTTLAASKVDWSDCDVTVAAMPVGDTGHVRQHLVVMHTSTGFQRLNLKSGVASYPSDLFRCDHVSGEVATGADATRMPEAWTLLGVVEGVPPFTRNGVAGGAVTSVVRYGGMDAKSLKVTQAVGVAISMSASIGSDKTLGAGAEVAASFDVAFGREQTVTARFEEPLANEKQNVDGRYGWLVISRPKLRGARYTRVPYDQRGDIGSYFVVWVVRVDIGQVAYELDAPRKGMRRRDPSSNYASWKQDVPAVDGAIEPWQPQELEASTKGGGTWGSLEFGEKTELSTTFKTTVTLRGNVGMESLFNLKSSLAVSYSYATTVTSSHSRSLAAKLDLPYDAKERPPDGLSELSVAPTWLVAREGVELPDLKERPFWLPEEYAHQGLIPWCVTWQVTHATPLDAATPSAD